MKTLNDRARLPIDFDRQCREMEPEILEEYGEGVLDVFKARAAGGENLTPGDVLRFALETVYAEEIELSKASLHQPFTSERFFAPLWQVEPPGED